MKREDLGNFLVGLLLGVLGVLVITTVVLGWLNLLTWLANK